MESFTLPFQLATDFINRTNRAVFLTGKAGTGKTTFLREIKLHTHKQTAVVAPTGVAAINAGGATIHSFFQLPFNPYLPEKQQGQPGSAVAGKNELIGRVKINVTRRKIFQELELLIIDEISMVRCDTMDAIDVLLRHFRHRPNEPFGGVQVLLIGDMYQLSPVAGEREWSELSPFYKSRYFFHSRVMMQQPPVYIELDKIYRQKNENFIKVLNEVRNNNLSPEGYALLNDRYDPGFIAAKEDNYITLSTHNYIADKINIKELATLNGKTEIFSAIIKGEYPENIYPIDSKLEFKIGAKVMFIKNDLEKDKRYYNGKIGTITSIAKDTIQVQCPNESEQIIVSQYLWENIKYEVDATTQLIEEKVVGTFLQFPLRLAWAITIHKSQGLTFERAIIDAGKAFAPGQVYVALSRCTSLEGLVLMSPINPGSLSNDHNIVSHSNSKPAFEETERFLSGEKKRFQQQLLSQLFDFEINISQAASLEHFVQTNSGSFNLDSEDFIQNLRSLLSEVQVTARKFQAQLQNLFAIADLLPEELQKRITAASDYFRGKIDELVACINECNVETDSKTKAQNFDDALSDLFIALALKQHIIAGIKTSFAVEAYYKARRSFIVPAFKVDTYSGKKSNSSNITESAHPSLLQKLRALRAEICEGKDLPVYIVAGNATLLELSNFLPLNPHDLAKISGFGPAKIQNYGKQFLDVINAYCVENDLSTLIDHKSDSKVKKAKDSKAPKIDTKLTSFEHYQSGKTPQEIAELRGFTVGTIQGHLAHYVINGDIQLSELINVDRIKFIEAALQTSPDADLNALKQTLGDDISYGEIRLVSKLYKEREKGDKDIAI